MNFSPFDDVRRTLNYSVDCRVAGKRAFELEHRNVTSAAAFRCVNGKPRRAGEDLDLYFSVSTARTTVRCQALAAVHFDWELYSEVVRFLELSTTETDRNRHCMHSVPRCSPAASMTYMTEKNDLVMNLNTSVISTKQDAYRCTKIKRAFSRVLLS